MANHCIVSPKASHATHSRAGSLCLRLRQRVGRCPSLVHESLLFPLTLSSRLAFQLSLLARLAPCLFDYHCGITLFQTFKLSRQPPISPSLPPFYSVGQTVSAVRLSLPIFGSPLLEKAPPPLSATIDEVQSSFLHFDRCLPLHP